MHSRRGEATLLVLGILALIGAGAWAGTHVAAKYRERVVAKHEQAAAKVASTEQLIATENREQVRVAHEAVVATGVAIVAAQTRVAGGEMPVKELNTAKTLNDTARGALDAAEGPVAPARVRELEQMVAGLNQGLATARGALGALQGQLDQSVAREAKLTDRLASARADLVKRGEQLEQYAAEQAASAARYQRLKWSLISVAGGVAALWLLNALLPLLSTLVPALRPLAAVFGAVVAPSLQAAKTKAEAFGRDMVGALEDTKSYVASRLTPEELEKLKKEILAAWSTPHDGTAATVERYRQDLGRI